MDGRQRAVDVEEWRNLSMNPNSTLYAPTVLTQQSKLVSAAAAAGLPNPQHGFSQSGRPVPYQHDPGDPNAEQTHIRDAWAALIGTAGAFNAFLISVRGSRYVPVDLSGIDVGALDPTVGDDRGCRRRAARGRDRGRDQRAVRREYPAAHSGQRRVSGRAEPAGSRPADGCHDAAAHHHARGLARGRARRRPDSSCGGS